MTDDRTFKFKSGYSIRVRDDYDPRFYQLTRESYREDNPPPEPPIIEKTQKPVPQKDGMKQRPPKIYQDFQDETYLRAYAIWEMAMYSTNSETLLDMAIEPTSIDSEVVEAGRAWAASQGIGVPRNDIQAYLRFVVTPPVQGKEDESELLKFYRWLNEMGGPSEALVQQFIATFRATVQEKPGKQSATDLQRVQVAN